MPHKDLIIDGIKWPSVTDIIGVIRKEFLETWRGAVGNNEADRISEASKKLGREVHKLIELYFQGKNQKYSKEAKKIFEVFKQEFLEKYKPKLIASEQHLINEEEKFHGTFDAVVQFPIIPEHAYPGFWLVDFKVSKSEDKTRCLQLAGYYKLLPEDQRPEHGMIVRVHPIRKTLKITVVKDLKQYALVFLACKKIWEFLNEK